MQVDPHIAPQLARLTAWLTARLQPQASVPRWRAMGVLAVCVAALHGALLLRWSAAPAPPAGRSMVAPWRVVLTLPTTQPVPAAAPADADRPAQGVRPSSVQQAGAAPARAAPPGTAPLKSTRDARTSQASPAAIPTQQAPGATSLDADRQAPPPQPQPPSELSPAVATAAPSSAADAGDEPALTPAALAAISAAAQGTPPPVYATRIPEPGQWHYTAQIGQRSGRAVLSWQHDGERYRLQLQADGPAGPLLQQVSTGGFDAAGLAPERFTDRRRARGERAANFQRESGRITFSGPRIEYPAWAGAQDRLGWIVQLAAIASAAGAVPPEVALFVVDGRGVGDVWTFVNQGQVVLDRPVSSGGAAPTAAVPTTPVPTTHVLREPQRPWDWRVEAWLDARQGFWPLRLRMTAPRGGAVFELQAEAPEPTR